MKQRRVDRAEHGDAFGVLQRPQAKVTVASVAS
jgi:hypothetical protein